MSDEFVSLSFRAYLSQRRKRYGPGSEILAAWMRDDEFAAITSQQELDDYLARPDSPSTRGFLSFDSDAAPASRDSARVAGAFCGLAGYQPGHHPRAPPQRHGKSIRECKKAALQPLRCVSPGRTVWIERLALDGRKKNDNQGSVGVVGNLDVPALPVLLLGIATHVIPY